MGWWGVDRSHYWKYTLILITIIVGCAPKVNKTFVLEMPITYEEEKKVADKYPVEPVEIKELNEKN